jgi:hypothetical protein
MPSINISSQTRTFARNNNAKFIDHTLPHKSPHLPKYITRLQSKIWSKARIVLPQNTNFHDVVNLSYTMQKEIPYIHRYSYNNINKTHSLLISLNRQGSFILTGYTIDLYGFITSQLGFTILSSLWDDNFSEEDVVQLRKLSKTTFYNSILNIQSLDKCPDQCCICKEPISNIQNSCKTNCKHYFHTKCLENWCTNFNSLCPMCRTPIDQ